MEFLSVTSTTESEIAKNLNEIYVKLEMDLTGTDTWVEIPASYISVVSITDKLSDIGGGAIANTGKVTLFNESHVFSSNVFNDEYDPDNGKYNGAQQSDGYGNLRPWRKVRISLQVGESTEWIQRFIGFIDGKGFQETVGRNSTNTVNLALIDMSKLLIDTDFEVSGNPTVLVNYKVCDPVTTSNSLVHYITQAAGIDDADVVCNEIDKTVPYAVLDGTGWEMISQLAEEYLGIVTFLPSGELYFGDSQFETGYVENQTPEIDITNDALRSIKKTNAWDEIKNDIEVEWTQFGALGKQVIWSFAEDYNEVLAKCQYIIADGDEDLDITNPLVEYKAEYATKDGYDVIYAADIDSQSEFEANIESSGGSLDVETFDTTTYPDGAVIRIANNSGGPVILEKLIISGKPLVELKLVTENQIDQTSKDLYGQQKMEKTASFMSDTGVLQTYTAWHKDFRSQPRDRFALSLDIPLINASVGSLVRIRETLQGTGIDGVIGKIESVKLTIKPGGASTISLDVKQWLINWSPTISTTPRVSQTTESGQDSASNTSALTETFVSREEYVSDATQTDEGSELTTIPTVPTLTLVGDFRMVTVGLDWQANLSGFDHYDLQVSGNASDWYDLDFTAAGWGGTLDAFTSIKYPRVFHTEIDPVVTSDADGDYATARTLYYRARRIANGTTTSWSTPVSVATKIVDSGTVGLNAIKANNLDVNILNAVLANINESLTIDADNGYVAGGVGTPVEGDTRAYLDEDEILIEEYDGSAWQTQIGFQGGTIVGLPDGIADSDWVSLSDYGTSITNAYIYLDALGVVHFKCKIVASGSTTFDLSGLLLDSFASPMDKYLPDSDSFKKSIHYQSSTYFAYLSMTSGPTLNLVANSGGTSLWIETTWTTAMLTEFSGVYLKGDKGETGDEGPQGEGGYSLIVPQWAASESPAPSEGDIRWHDSQYWELTASADPTSEPGTTSDWSTFDPGTIQWPIGSTYIQFPGKSDPASLGLPGTWTNVSSEIAGDFIRFEGGSASTFGAGEQADRFQGHYHAGIYYPNGLGGGGGDWLARLDYSNASNAATSRAVSAPSTDGTNGTPRTGSETRPVNRTVRLWERTA